MVAPLAVTVHEAPRDSAFIGFTLAGSTADYAYVTRGCNGEILSAEKRSFREAGGAADVGLSRTYHVGVRATQLSTLESREGKLQIWNPYVSLEGSKFGLGLGAVIQPDVLSYTDSFEGSPVSGHLRFGRRSAFHTEISLSEGVPLYGTGLAYLGFGFRPASAVDLMLGLSSPAPYDQFGALARAEIGIGRHLGMQVRGRYGGSASVTEAGISVGISYYFLRRQHAAETEAPVVPAVPTPPATPPPDTTARDSS